ncbi:MAG: hypothetical protein K8T10_12355 [Candidatus Eremiobacteraeota bacterium]|nr:hypothetical protein [Candidatus Eremiobacteraeota bacterium]
MKFKKQKGIALIAVLMLLMAMMVLTMGFAHYTLQDHITSKSFHSANMCFYLAQAGLEYSMFLLKHNLLVYPYAPYADHNSGEVNVDNYTPAGSGQGLGLKLFEEMEQGGGVNVNDGVNDFDDNPTGGDGKIDATSGLWELPMVYDADLFDGTSDVYQPGDIINLYDTDGHEHLLITKLTVGSVGEVGEILGNADACGTFRVKVIEKQDPNASSDADKRVLFIKSTGMIKKVPTDWSGSPQGWDVSTFPIISRRTLIMRIPYSIESSKSLAPSSGTNYKILSDGWFERFR